jgi:hypothetical protein
MSKVVNLSDRCISSFGKPEISLPESGRGVQTLASGHRLRLPNLAIGTNVGGIGWEVLCRNQNGKNQAQP